MNNLNFNITILLLLTISLTNCRKQVSQSFENVADYSGWTNYAGTKDGLRYSSNSEINKKNVEKLQEVWRYSSNDRATDNKSQNQCNPIIVDGVLYGTSPKSKLFALNAFTGKQKWVFDPSAEEINANIDTKSFYNTIRGVVFWQDKDGGCRRIFYNAGSKTYCVDATEGKLIKSFGNEGYLDLSKNLGRDNQYVSGTSPGIIYNDLLILGTRVSETAEAAPGNVRAYNVLTGDLKWTFHTIPYPGEFGYETWPDKDAWKKLGGANNWAGMSLDENKGILYVPTGSVSGDFYGGIRKGQNLFANSLIAMDAASGEYLWHYQVIHHDLWDRDLPANPNLVTLQKDGETIEAVAQITKHGYVFLFDRLNGKPIFPIEERPVPQNALPGEEPWPTQPIPTLPEPFSRQSFSRDDVAKLDSETHEEMLQKFDRIKYNEMFTPPSKEGAWIFPGFDGGGEWGGAAVDPESQVLYVNSSELPWSLTMIDVPKNIDSDRSIKGIGKSTYNKYCVTCHGNDLQGNGDSFPSLLHIKDKYVKKDLKNLISNGKNKMPAFKQIPKNDVNALTSFLLDLEEKEAAWIDSTEKIITTPETLAKPKSKSILDLVPYNMTGYNRFLDKNGYPGITPPWGTLNAVDLSSGKLLWKVPLGEYPELTKKGIPPTGTENYGGPVVTKGGLVFIAATKDAKIRAFDKHNGKVLWEADLPVPGYATPSVYEIDGKQFIVIACGGGKIGSKSGDQYLAFSLP